MTRTDIIMAIIENSKMNLVNEQQILTINEKQLSDITTRLVDIPDVVAAKLTVCDHNWIDGRVTCGTEVCTKCNDARLKQTVLSNSVCKGDHYKNGVCSKYFGWCTEEQCDYWKKE